MMWDLVTQTLPYDAYQDEQGIVCKQSQPRGQPCQQVQFLCVQPGSQQSRNVQILPPNMLIWKSTVGLRHNRLVPNFDVLM